MTAFNNPATWSQMIFGNQGPNMSPQAQALRDISKISNDKTRSFQQNIVDLNTSVSFMSGYMNVMQDGIDEANKNIVQKIQDMINDIFIIFNGGDGAGDTGFDWGDLKYILQALGALFGFQGLEGPANLAESAGHFFTNFLNPSELFQGGIQDLVTGGMEGFFGQLLGLLTGIPIIGDIIAQIAGIINQKQPGQQATNLSELGSMESLDVRNYFVAAFPSHFSYMNTGGVAHSGANFLQVDPPDSAYTVGAYHNVSNEFPVTPYEKIQMEWWQRRNNANFSATLAVHFKNAAGASLGTLFETNKYPPIGATNTTWVTYQNEVTAPEGATTAQVRIVLVNPVGTLTGTWQVDDIVVRRSHESPDKTPLWQGINKDEETTFPRSSLNYGSAGDTSAVWWAGLTAGWHHHPLGATPQYQPQGYGANRMELGFIRVQKNRAITRIGCITGDSVQWFGIEAIYAALYKMDPVTGALTLVNPTTAGTNRSSSLNNTNEEHRFLIGQTVSVRVDEIYAIGILQRTNSVQSTQSICATTLNNISAPSAGFPKKNYATAGPYSTPPASIPHSSINYDGSNRIPFYVME